MGNCDCNVKDINENLLNDEHIKLDDFYLLHPIGRGGFGRVWKVRLKRPFNSKVSDIRLQKNKSRIFAMKEMSKAKIYLKKSIKSVANERKFLENFNYNLLCNMYYAFQDDDTLYIIMDYLSGGDLRYHICRRNYFTEEETRFIAACITLNLNYIHDKNVVHRDLKPENLVFGGDGYLHLTDFGIAMEYHRGETGVISASGTPGYMSPEAIINKPHDFSTDYFALGVIVYELMMGERPYQGRNRKEIREQMFSIEIKLDNDDLPDDWEDNNIIDFINKLLARKKKKRLGYKNGLEVKNHPWFNDISWTQIENMTIDSPFVFDTEDNFDDSYANQQENDSIYEDKLDQIYNLACPASPPHYQKDPLFTINTCFIGITNMLNLAKKNKCKILQASTSEIYGDPIEHPQKETYWGHVNCFGIRSCYDEGKRSAETLCFNYINQFNVDVKVIRIFNTYGPSMAKDDGRVVTNFINQALYDEDITIYGDGSQTRSFQYVDDLIEAMTRVMNTDSDFHGPINLGNPHEFTMKELAEITLELIKDSKSKITYQELPKDDPCKRKPDISLAKEKIKWEPVVQLREGLQKTIDYFRMIKELDAKKEK